MRFSPRALRVYLWVVHRLSVLHQLLGWSQSFVGNEVHCLEQHAVFLVCSWPHSLVPTAGQECF